MLDEESLSVGQYDDNFAKVIREWEVRRHVGRILTLVDSLGFEPKREKAVKDLFRSAVYLDFWNNSTTHWYNRVSTKEGQEALDKVLEDEQKRQQDMQSHTASAKK